jgi:glycosyltransferase involved in cell wall biosynthesis
MIYVHPAGHESFGISIAEAMSCGLPVITTRRGAIPEVVGDARLYVPFNDESSLAEAILTLLNNEELRKELSIKARERAVKMFDVSIRAEKLKKLIDRVII